jgi:hypothetical protein
MTDKPGDSHPDPLDSRLRALFGSLDAPAGFDAAVMARVKVESNAVTVEAIKRAELAEYRRYRTARSSLSWTHWVRRVVTLESVGLAVLAVFALQLIWARLSSRLQDLPPLPASVAQYLPLVLTCVAAAVPLILAVVVTLSPKAGRRRLTLA